MFYNNELNSYDIGSIQQSAWDDGFEDGMNEIIGLIDEFKDEYYCPKIEHLDTVERLEKYIDNYKPRKGIEMKRKTTIQNNNGQENSLQLKLIKELGEEGYVQQLYDFLQGKYHPSNILDEDRPKLTIDQAWHTIYCLQEHFGVLDDRFEKCKKCGDIYDSYEGGTSINEESKPDNREWEESEYGNYCEDCRPD